MANKENPEYRESEDRYKNSYEALYDKLKGVIRNEVRTISEAKWSFKVLLILMLLPNLIIFLFLALISFIFWPLGDLRDSVVVGIFFAMLVPIFQLLLTLFMCSGVDRYFKLTVESKEYEEPLKGIIVSIPGTGLEPLVTNTHGQIAFPVHLTKPNFGAKILAREYCSDCFQDIQMKVILHDPETGIKKLDTVHFNYGTQFFPYVGDPTYFEEEDTILFLKPLKL